MCMCIPKIKTIFYHKKHLKLYNFLTNSREYFNYIPYFCQMPSEILLLYIFSSVVYSAKFNIQLFSYTL